jgi:aspartate aminotransferase-like enzyme
MTTIDDKDASKIRSALKEEYGVNVAGGQDHLKGKIFRINQMGLINTYESIWVVNSIELILHRMGRLEYSGVASKVYNETYFKSALEKKEI